MMPKSKSPFSLTPAALMVVLGGLAALDVLRALGWLLGATAAAGVAYWSGRRGFGGQEAGQLARVAAERDRLTADLAEVASERDQLAARILELARQLDQQDAEHRAERDRLTEAMHAAWDAAANTRPASARSAGQNDDVPSDVAAMLADPLSGVRRLGS